MRIDVIMVDKLDSDRDEVENKDKEKHMEILGDIMKTAKQMEASIDVFIDKANSGPDTSHGLSFLDLKNDLMMDYNLNLIYLMYKKSLEGKIEADSAVERLCYLRTVLEKIRPIEHKLKYQIDKCVTVAETGQIGANDPSRFKANPDLLATKFADNDDEDSADEEDEDEEKGPKKYVAPKNVPAYFDGDKTKEEMEIEMAAKKKKTALSHSMMRELQHQLYDAPEEISHEADVKKQKYIAKEREKELYEEENFTRLPVTKSERLAKKNVFTVSNIGDSLTSFGNSDYDGTGGGGGGKKRKRAHDGGKGAKSKKKFKIKKKKFK